MQLPQLPQSVSSCVYFVKKSTVHEAEKPYAFRYAVSEVNQTNMEMEKIDGIPITDIRRRECDYSFEEHGFAVLKLNEGFGYSLFFDTDGLRHYFQTLEILLKNFLGASEVRIFRHGIRKRHPEFPVSIGESYEYEQPTSVAHIDTTLEETRNEISRQYGVEAPAYLQKPRYQWINIWKPLRGPLNDWPLTVCSSANLSQEDVEPADLLYPDLATENYQVYYREKYKWFYLSDHNTSEIIVFKQSDSNPKACFGVPHCSFFNSLASTEEAPRESIGVRALVFYD